MNATLLKQELDNKTQPKRPRGRKHKRDKLQRELESDDDEEEQERKEDGQQPDEDEKQEADDDPPAADGEEDVELYLSEITDKTRCKQARTCANEILCGTGR